MSNSVQPHRRQPTKLSHPWDSPGKNTGVGCHFLNQGKLEVVKQEMARVNIDILGISEPKWPGMGEFNSDDHYIYHCGQEPLRRNAVALIVNKRFQNAVLGCNLKNDRMISVHFQGKPLKITVIQVYAPTSNAEEAEIERFYEDLQDLLELIPPPRPPKKMFTFPVASNVQ